ncbi:hypothetical protein ACHAW5_001324 [Stephanodiscus triporus]|uniref:Uncharacterized protein n=1 Tax=Stephanodiscus triporus TaxID=2934178 RepID=A0ABD3Q241_9STRA
MASGAGIGIGMGSGSSGNFNLLSNGANNKGSSMAGGWDWRWSPPGSSCTKEDMGIYTFESRRAEVMAVGFKSSLPPHKKGGGATKRLLRFAQAIQEYLKKAQYKKESMFGIGFSIRHYRFTFSTPARRNLFESRGLPTPRQIGIIGGPGCYTPLTPVEAVYSPEPRQKWVCTERYIESSCDRRFFDGVQGANTTIIGGGIVRSGFSSIDDESCWIPLTPPRLGGGIIEQGCPPVDLSPFQIDGGADEVEEAAEIGYNTPKAMVSVARQFARCQPVLGLMWVRHPEHGLVRRSARIAARTTCKP